MNDLEQSFEELKNVNIRKPSIHTVKRPVSVLRYNTEVLAKQGATQREIEDYLAENGADIDLVMSFPMPSEEALNRTLERERSGEWGKEHEKSVADFNEYEKRQEARDSRIKNLQGLQGGVRSFGNGLFLNYGDELENYLTGQDIDQIRQEQSDWSRKNPTLDLGLGIAGGMLPTLAGFGAGGATMGKTALTRMLMGAGTGIGIGGVAGYGAGTGDWTNRLESAGYGSLFGGGIGALTPLAIGGVGRATGRIARGFGKGPTEQQVDDFVLNKIVAQAGRPGNKARRDASLLLQGIQDGDVPLQDAMANLQNKTLVALDQINPGITELAKKPSWTPQTASTKQIINAFTTDSKQAAMDEFGQFVAQQPDKTGAGLALNHFFEKNPVAAKIVKANKRRIGDNMTTYEGLQKIDETLDRNLPTNLHSDRIVNRNADILDAKADLAALRETLFPGQNTVDAMYRASSSVQNHAQKKALSFLDQLASGVTNPTNAEMSLTGASKIGLKPYVRGRARELIERGALEPDRTSFGEQLLQGLGFDTYRTLEQQK